jgi:predicted DNA-binding transcriptional regulator AlpA
MIAEMMKYLDEATAARLLKVGQRTLQRWRISGHGPRFIRAGPRRVLYDAAEIERWASSRTFAHRAAELSQHTA